MRPLVIDRSLNDAWSWIETQFRRWAWATIAVSEYSRNRRFWRSIDAEVAPGLLALFDNGIYIYTHVSCHHVSNQAHHLSLAQLEERKTVTAITSWIRYLEARGSIPRGETIKIVLLLYSDVVYLLFWCCSCKSNFSGHREIFDILAVISAFLVVCDDPKPAALAWEVLGECF